MTLSEMADRLGLARLTPELADCGTPAAAAYSSRQGGDRSAAEGGGATAEVSRGHVGDLLSDVLANAPRGGVLVTIQTHLNVIAVALNAEVAAVIFAWGRTPEEAVRRKAFEEGIRLYGSRASAFDIVGRLYALGVRGRESSHQPSAISQQQDGNVAHPPSGVILAPPGAGAPQPG